MSAHASCTHEATKAARAACRAGQPTPGGTQGATPAKRPAARQRPAVSPHALPLGASCTECNIEGAWLQDGGPKCVRHLDNARAYKIMPL